MEYKIILAGGTELHIDGFALPLHIAIDCTDRADANAKWALLDGEHDTITLTGDGDVIASYANVALVNSQFFKNGDGTVTAHFYLSGDHVADEPLTDADREYIEAAKIMLGEEE